MRLYRAHARLWDDKPGCGVGGWLDSQVLEILFSWLVEGGGSGDHSLDTRLALRIWDYVITRAKTSRKDRGEYDLPSPRIGYDVLLKLGAQAIAAPAGHERAIWEPVLTQYCMLPLVNLSRESRYFP